LSDALNSDGTKGFLARDFLVLGLPLHRPKDPGRHVVRNGALEMKVIADSAIGVPYGADQLVPLAIDTAYKMLGCPEDGIVCFQAAADFLRLMRLPSSAEWESWRPGGREVRELVASLDRCMEATFYVTDERVQGARRKARYQLMSEYVLWFDQQTHPNQHTLFPNAIRLDPTHAADVRRGGVPVDLDLVRGLRSSAQLMRFGLWQRWRSHAATAQGAEVRVPLFEPGGLAEQFEIGGPSRAVRQTLKRWQVGIKRVWPDCPNELMGDYFVVRPQSGPALVVDERFLRRIARSDHNPFQTGGRHRLAAPPLVDKPGG
jgi:hypothetical protein